MAMIRLLPGFGIWPQHSAGFGKRCYQGSGIRQSLGADAGWIEKENDIRDMDEISSGRMPNSRVQKKREYGIKSPHLPHPPPLSRPYFMWVFPRMKLNPGYVLIEMNIWIPGVNNSVIKSWHCYRFRRSVSVYYTYNVTRTDYLPLSLLSETCRPSDMFRRAVRYFRTQCLVYLPSPC